MAENKINLEKYVLTNWLADYEPYQESNYDDENTPDIVYLTSADIADKLSDMVNLSLNDVAYEMIARGYYIGQSPDHRTCWILARRQF